MEVQIPGPDDNITDFKASFLHVYTYPFTLGPDKSVESPPLEIDPVILDFCDRYQVMLGQIYPFFGG